jgi:hypothetical protein
MVSLQKAVTIGAHRINWSGKPMLGWRCGGCGRCCWIWCASTGEARASGGVGAFFVGFLSTASLTLSATIISCVPSSGSFPSSFSLFSNPFTRFNNASSTSVLGPLFLGTASMYQDESASRISHVRYPTSYHKHSRS